MTEVERDAPVVTVFATNVVPKYPVVINVKSDIGGRQLSARSLSPMEKETLSNIENHQMEEHCNVQSKKMLISDSVSNSSDDDRSTNGLDNCSFDVEVNRHILHYQTFGRHSADGVNLKDGTNIIALDKGKCVVADLLACRLLVFSKSGKINAILQNEDFIEPWGLFLHDNVILVTSRRKRRVMKISQSGDEIEPSFGENYFQDPCGIAVTKNNRIVISDVQSKKVSVHEWSGRWIHDICLPNDKLSFKCIRYLTVSPVGDILISDSGNHCIFVFSSYGAYKMTVGSYGSSDGQLKAPYGVCCDQFGNIFVSDHYNDRVSVFSRDGDFIRHIATQQDGIFHPQGIVISRDMKLFVTHGSLKACEVKVFGLMHSFVR